MIICTIYILENVVNFPPLNIPHFSQIRTNSEIHIYLIQLIIRVFRKALASAVVGFGMYSIYVYEFVCDFWGSVACLP